MARSRFSEPVRVINVVDGDTIDVVPVGTRRRGEVTRVRLWGIDAPEWEQPLGPEAARALAELLRDGPGVLRMEVFAYDQYARAIALLYWERNGRGRSINRAMIEMGYAYTSRHRQGQYYREVLGFDGAETRARRQQLGFWAMSAEERERPWAYRSRQREHAQGCLLPVVVTAALAFVLLTTAWTLSSGG